MPKSINGYKETLISRVDIHCMDQKITLYWFDFHVARFILDFLKVFYETTKELFDTYYCISHLFVHNIFKINTQFKKYMNDDLLDIFNVKMEGKGPSMMGLSLQVKLNEATMDLD